MANENVSLRIIGTLDVAATKPIIDAKIAELEKQIKPLKLTIDIDENILKKLNDFSIKVAKVQEQLKGKKTTPFIDPEYEKQLKDNLATFDQIIQKYKAVGDIKISKDALNPLTGDLEKFTLNITKSTGEVEKLKFELASLKGLVVGGQENTLFVPTKVSSVNSTNLNSLDQEGVKLAQLVSEQDKATQSLNKLYNQGYLTEELFNKFNYSISSAKDVEEINKITQALQNQIQVEKNAIQQADLLSKAQSMLSSGKIVDTVGLETLITDLKNIDTTSTTATRELSLLQSQLKSFSTSTASATETAASFGTAMKESFAPLSMYFGGFMLFQQGISQIKAGISTLNDLNKSLTTISMITHQSQEQVAGLTQQYQQLGQQLSVSTTDIASTATELTRQGLSIDEVNSRLKTITEFSKVAGLSATDAMTYITAASNSMKISAQEASDTFAELGHVSGVNAAYVAQAYQKVGGTAGAVGLDFNKVASWITTEGERSKESADTIGSSIKSIIARIQSLKEKGFDSTDGTSVNQVAKALSAVGIALMDDQGQFRNFGNVMDELGKKWSSLDSRQRAYLATTIAGTYQQSRFLDLMQGYSRSVTLYNDALNSTGVTQQKFNDWSQGTEAALGRLQNAFQGIWIAAFNSNEIQNAINGLTSLANGIQTVVKFAGGLPTIIGAAALAFMAFNTNIRTSITEFGLFSTSFIKAGDSINISSTWSKVFSTAMLSMQTMARATGVAMEALGTTIKAVGVFIAEAILPVGALMLATAAIQKLNENYQQQQQQQADLQNRQNELTQSYQTNKNKIDELVSSYDKLSNIRNRTSDQEKQYTDVQNQLAQILPQVKIGEDAKGNAIIASSSAIKEQIGLLQQQISLQNQASKNAAPQNILNNANAINQKSYWDDSTGGLQQQLDYYKKMDAVDQDLLKNQKEQGLSQDEIVKLRAEDTKYLIEQNIIQGEINSKQQANAKIIQSYFSDSKINSDAITQISSALSQISLKGKSVGDIDTMFTGITKSVNDLNDALQKNNANGINEAVKELEQLGVKASLVKDIENALKDSLNNATKATNSQTTANGQATQSATDYASAVQKEIDAANQKATAEEQIVGNTQSMINETKSLVTQYELLSNQENLSADQKQVLADAIGKLSALYPQYTQNGKLNVEEILKEAEADDILLKAVNDVTSGKATAEEQMTITQAQETKNRIQMISDEIDAYQKLIDATYAAAQANGGQMNGAMSSVISSSSDKIGQLKQQVDALNSKYSSQIQSLANLTNYQGQYYQGTSNSTSATQNSIYVTDKYTQSLNKLNAEISNLQNAQKQYATDSAQYRSALQQEIDLQTQKLKLMQDQEKSLQSQIASGNIAQYGIINNGGSTVSTGGGTTTGSYGSTYSLVNKNLNQIPNVTADQLNAWIAQNAPSNSNLRGMGSTFIQASQASGLDPVYLLAHMALETGWGTSNIWKTKANAYGIGAFDSSPYSSAHSFSDYQAGIIQGAQWISQNFVNGKYGQNTLQKMRFNNGVHQYATDPGWADSIAGIMRSSGLESGTFTTGSSKSSSSSGNSAAQQAQAVDQAKQSLLQLNSDILTTQQTIQQLQAEIVQSKIDQVTNYYDRNINNLNNSIKDSQTYQARFAAGSYQWNYEMNKQIGLTAEMNDQTTKEISELQNLIKTEQMSADQKSALNDKISQLKSTQLGYLNTISDLYKQERQQQTDADIQKVTDAYNAQIAAVQKKLDLLNQTNQAQQRATQLAQLQAQIDKAKSDTSHMYIDKNGNVQYTYDKTQVATLQQQMDDQKAQWAQQDQQQALQDQITNLQNTRDSYIAKLQQLNTDYQTKAFQNTKDLQNIMKQFVSDLANVFGVAMKIPKHHDGGIVGSITNNTGLGNLVNNLFNVKPGEQIVKALKGEVMIPPKNIPNFFTNIKSLVSGLGSNVVQPIVKNYNLSNFTIKSDNVDELWQGIESLIQSQG